jgi:hypothetical protein
VKGRPSGKKKTTMNSSIQIKTPIALLLLLVLLACFGLLPAAKAVGPDTEGAIPGSNNGEGIGVLISRTTGVWNTGTGFEALNHLTAGNQNTATGLRALFTDTSGGFNTATGVYSLYSNTVGFFNSATGAYSLAHNIDGDGNTANGYGALYYNNIGGSSSPNGILVPSSYNTANGYAALYHNTTGSFNTANGYFALYTNTTGVENVANGFEALRRNTGGIGNTAEGVLSLGSNITGNFNTALGNSAGFNVTSADNVICIGTDGQNLSDSCFIGNIYSNIQPVVGTDPDVVTVNAAGRLGRANVSSRRYKHDIKPMGQASEALYALRPVSFRYQKEYDATQTLAFGLIAEDVAEVYPDLVGRNPEGEPESVRYERINAMLLNEFIKEHCKVQDQERRIQEQEATIAQLKKEIETVVARLKEQDSKIQKVSDQIELSKFATGRIRRDGQAPQIVMSNP